MVSAALQSPWRPTALIGIAALGSVSAHANPEQAYLADLPVVLSASRMPQPLNEAPGAVTVIEGDFIRASGYRDLARIFSLVPGMQIGRERAHNYWVTYHGLGSTFPSELQILIDGRSVYSPSAFGGIDWATLPVNADSIDRIEIVRGPNAVSYGANAFMGVINIITRHTMEEPISLVRAHAGDSDIADLDAMTHARLGDATVRMWAKTRNDSGFAQLNDSRHTATVGARADWRLSNADELTLRLNHTAGRKGEGYDQSLFNSNGERTSRLSAQTAHLTWTRAPSAGEESIVQYYHIREQVTDAWRSVIGPSYPYGPTSTDLDRNRSSTRDHLEFQHRVSSTRRQTVWGGELQRDRIRAPYLFSGGNPDAVMMYRGFANLDEHLSRVWQLNLGASLERYKGEPLHFAPRAFLNAQVTPAQTLRAGVSRAWQQRPTFEQNVDIRVIDPATGALLVHAFKPNPDLRQSRIDSVELGYLGRFRALDSSLDVRLFNERIKDYVVRMPADANAALTPYIGSSQYVNFERPITLRGVEYQFKARPTATSEFLLSHSMIDRHAGDSHIEDRIAPYVASFSWRQKWAAAWSTTLTAVRMGPLSGGDGFVPVSSYVAKAYTTFDARIAWQTAMGRGKKLEISLNALNLGERHQEIPDRAEQRYRASLGDDTPANYASRMIYVAASLEF